MLGVLLRVVNLLLSCLVRIEQVVDIVLELEVPVLGEETVAVVEIDRCYIEVPLVVVVAENLVASVAEEKFAVDPEVQIAAVVADKVEIAVGKAVVDMVAAFGTGRAVGGRVVVVVETVVAEEIAVDFVDMGIAEVAGG